ncbi:MAG: fibronectin type III domain-containing protein, partial [Halobacteriales archaeon]|nr:fibronectin type III domain-containing protein [Halobacteriales archaeon]
GSHFLEGPFTLDAGHYRVEAFSSTGHPGGDEDHFAKAKMFWVEPCASTPPPPPPPALECPSDVSATANADGSITIGFTAAPGSDGTNVYRLDADGDFQLLATVSANETSYTDTNTTAGSAYTYAVTALYGDRESQECPVVEASAIPEFPTAVAVGLAASCGLLAYAFVRRKK